MQQQIDFSYKFKNMRAELNKINYSDQKTKIRISESLIFLNFAVVFMPASFLRLFSFDWYYLPMLHRFRADVAYLEVTNPAFADAYRGSDKNCAESYGKLERMANSWDCSSIRAGNRAAKHTVNG